MRILERLTGHLKVPCERVSGGNVCMCLYVEHIDQTEFGDARQIRHPGGIGDGLGVWGARQVEAQPQVVHRGGGRSEIECEGVAEAVSIKVHARQ